MSASASERSPSPDPQEPQLVGRHQGHPLLLGGLFFLLCLQTITLTGRIGDDTGPAVKLYHVAFIPLLLLVLRQRSLVAWRGEAVLYFVVTAISGAISMIAYAATPAIVNLAFGAYVVLVTGAVARNVSRDMVLRVLRVVAATILVLVIAKAFLYREAIKTFLAAPFGHPSLPLLFGGGPNLEATWVALGAALFLGSRLFLPYTVGSVTLSVLYASRIGFIVAGLILGVALLRRTHQYAISLTTRIAILLIATLACATSVFVLLQYQDEGGWWYIVERFASIGSDPGSVGRLTLWSGGVEVFNSHPFGVGQGNAVPHIEQALATSLPEDNLHNLFLQHLVETGPQGFFAFALLALLTWYRAVRDRYSDQLLVYLGVYLLVSLIQFRGLEPIFWLVYAAQSTASRSSTFANSASA